jgi:hypothetical protein
LELEAESAAEARRPVSARDVATARIHADAPEAGALRAKAFTMGRDIFFAPGRFQPDTTEGLRLLLHELAHVAQQAAGPAPPIQCDDLVCGADVPPDLTFIEPEECPSTPETYTSEVEIALAAPDRRRRHEETFIVEDEVLSRTPLVYYAVPLSLVTVAEDDGGICRLPPTQPAGSLQILSLQTSLQQTDPLLVLAPPPRRHIIARGERISVEAIVGEYAILSQHHTLAVGAAATTVVETLQGVRIFDAGVGHDGREALTQTTMNKLRTIIGDRPILEVVISHLHEDHTNLLPELAREFEIGRIRVGAAQYVDPRFQDLLAQVAAQQQLRVRAKAADEFDANRAEWERTQGARIADIDLREEAFGTAKAEHIEQAVESWRRTPTQIDLLVPNGGKLQLASAPVGRVLPVEQLGATPEPVSEGLRRTGAAGDISETAFTDPTAGEEIRDFQRRRAADPNARVRNIDQLSVSYIIDLPAGNRLIFVPDIRTDDLRRGVRREGAAERSNFEAELERLGHPAKFVEWNMTHHMQSGWLVGGAPHIAGTAELVAFTRLMGDVRRLQASRAAPGQTTPANIVSVSVQGDPANPLVRSLVNPAMVWFIRSLGFEVYLATSGRDLRMIEAVTPGGQKVAGVAGTSLAYEGLRPTEPLLSQSEAALRHLEQKLDMETARKAPRSMRMADKRALIEDREANKTRLRTAITDLEAARNAYIETVSRELWIGVHDDSQVGRQTRGATDPTRSMIAPDPAQPLPDSIRNAEASLRNAMRAPDLADFTAPEATTAPVITETALVLLRLEGVSPSGTSPLGARARQILEANERADALRAKIRSGAGDATTRVELAQELATMRGLLEEELRITPEASRPVLQEELIYAQRELESLTRPQEGTVTFTREPGTGKLIENRIIRVPASQAATQKVGEYIERGGRLLGAVMVIQTIRSEEELLERFESGQATTGQTAVGSLHNAHGLSIGLRMFSGVHVHPLEFVAMSVLDITQVGLGHFETSEEASFALAKSVVQNVVSLSLLTLSQVMMRSGNPWIMAAGAVVIFLAEPIMDFLEWLGVFDWIERRTAFLPSDVTAANQNLRDLMEEYRAIIGAMALASRSDQDLRDIGVVDPAAFRTTSAGDVARYRANAVEKEADLLSAFREAYETAKTEYAGLYELDVLRGQFLDLRAQAHSGDLVYGESSRQSALDTFWGIDFQFHLDEYRLDDYSYIDINSMPVWEELRSHIDDLKGELDEDDVSDVDWDDVREAQDKIEQILRSARYRLHPEAFGMRRRPLLTEGGMARQHYEELLAGYEQEFAEIQRSMAIRLSGQDIPAPDPAVPVSALTTAEAFLTAYQTLLNRAPERPFTPQQLYSHSADMGPLYRKYIEDNDGYEDYLEQLRSTEAALWAAFHTAARANVQSSREQVQNLKDRIDGAVSRRTDELALLFRSELDSRVAQIRASEIAQIAPYLSAYQHTQALSLEEEYALGKGDLEDYENLGTLTDRLERVPDLRIPDGDDETLGGIRRVVGDIRYRDYFLFGIRGNYPLTVEHNVLVGITGDGHETTTGLSGHTWIYPVVPLNDAAIWQLGQESLSLEARFLQPVLRKEVLPPAMCVLEPDEQSATSSTE